MTLKANLLHVWLYSFDIVNIGAAEVCALLQLHMDELLHLMFYVDVGI